MKVMKTRRRGLLIVAGVAAGLNAPVHAQSPDIKIEVTGSNIPRVAGEGPLPVQIVTRDAINRSGATNAQELMQLISANQSAGATNTTNVTGATTFGTQTASLRGLGGQRTLVLINGKRLASFGGEIQGNPGVDLNAIPFSAIERVEILKDGASAVYGSDAIGGVINFILRQDFSGVEATGYYGVPTRSGGGDSWQAKATAGWGDLTKDRYNVFVSAYYNQENALLLKDRDFGKTSYLPGINYNTSSGNTFPAYVSTGGIGSVFAYPNCQDFHYASLNVDGRCRYDPSPDAQAIPELTQKGAYASGRLQINPDWQAYVNGMYTQGITHWNIQPVPISDQFPTPASNPISSQYNGSILLPPTSPFYPHAAATAAGVDGQPLNVRYRAVENGNRDVIDTNDQWGVVGGAKGSFKNWDVDVDAFYNESKTKEHLSGGYPLLSKILPLLNSGQINVFGPNTPDTGAALQATNFVGDTFNGTNKMYGLEGKTSGDLYNLPAGPLALAVGASAWKEQFTQVANAALATADIAGYGGNLLSVDASRNVWATYAELNVPFVKNFEGDAAVRYDHYSDFGGTTNPKFSLRWQPSNQVLLRGSYGTGFLAPSLYQLYVPNTTSVTQPGLTDPVRCPITSDSNDCDTQFGVLFGGNRNLRPETSYQVNAGIVIEPVKGMSFSIDWFKINLSNAIANGVTPGTILDNQSQYGYLITRAPPAPPYPNLPGQITQIDQRYLNLGAIHLSGFDIDFKYVLPPASAGQFTFAINSTYMSRYDVQQPDGSYLGFVSNNFQAATTGLTPRFKSYATLNWTLGPWTATLANSYQSSYIDVQTDNDGNLRRVGSLSLWDIQASYTGFKNLTLTLGAKNLFDTNPPLTNQNISFQGGYDPTYYDARARLIYGSVTYAFK
jgi:iron complex outermembrane receptor protein